MRTSAPRLLPLFRSEPQLRMLARLLLQPDAPVTMAELRAASGMSAASLHRELLRALEAGLVERDETRRPHVFRAARDSPVYEPLTALLQITVGVEQELRDLLLGTPGVKAAAIHGSWANGTARASSDVDLLVIGEDVDARRLRADLRKLGGRIGRRIDLLLVERGALHDLVRSDNPFLRLVIDRPLVNLVGDVRALAAA
jgi:predicted nucleotidyltransferase